jgi:hypothetical protein
LVNAVDALSYCSLLSAGRRHEVRIDHEFRSFASECAADSLGRRAALARKLAKLAFGFTCIPCRVGEEDGRAFVAAAHPERAKVRSVERVRDRVVSLDAAAPLNAIA